MKKRRKIVIPPHYLAMLKELTDAPNEVGGGFTIENDEIIEIVIFGSDKRDSVLFTRVFDIEFHTHPQIYKDRASVVMYRTPSDNDVASVMSERVEEIIFTKGYIFRIGIDDQIKLRKAKYDISMLAKKKRWRYDNDFEKITKYLSKLSNKIWNSLSKEKDINRRAELYRKEWIKMLLDMGIIVERIYIKDGILYV